MSVHIHYKDIVLINGVTDLNITPNSKLTVTFTYMIIFEILILEFYVQIFSTYSILKLNGVNYSEKNIN